MAKVIVYPRMEGQRARGGGAGRVNHRETFAGKAKVYKQ